MNYEENLTYKWLRLLKEDESRGDVKKASESRPAAANTFGDFEYTVNSDGTIKIISNPPQLVNATLKCQTDAAKNHTVQFHVNYINNLEKAYYEGSAKGYCPKSAGTFSARVVRGPKYAGKPVDSLPLSNHSFGTAIDFDPSKNNFIPGKTSEMEQHPEFIEAFEKNGFNWLGDGAGRSGRGHIGDDMHFDIRFSGDYSGIEPASVASSDEGNSSFYSGASYDKALRTGLEKIGFTESKKKIILEDSSKCLSDDQIAKLLFDVGFRDEELVIAVRIVLGESGGCPRATNVNWGAKGKYAGSIDRGIFQFNNVAFPNFSDEDAFDPIKSAQYAFRVYKKVGFKPWHGRTEFHSLKRDGTPDTNKIERAKNAVEKLTGYVSTGNFEYLQSGGEGSELVDSGDDFYSGASYDKALSTGLEKIGFTESKIRIGKKFIVVNKTKNKDIENNKKILFSMLKYYDDKLQFDLPVKIIFKDDRDNSQKPLGKTGYYHPEETSITIFTTNRLLKDILRSLGHELIHHKQHCMHPFEHKDTPDGYAQSDKRLRRKEKEAYLFGNMLFRDFEDNYKTKHKGVF